MVHFGGDFGLSEFIYEKLNRFKEHLPATAQKKLAYFIEHTIYFFSIIGPIMTFPQVLKIYLEKDVAGLSLITWSSYLLLAIFWLAYGVLIGNRPIVLANVFWIAMHAFIITGILIYGG